VRFFCCCQGTDRTSCANCAAELGGQASCPAGTTCGTVPNPPFADRTTCIAPPGHECCGTYKWSAAGQIQPLACRYDLATPGNPCIANSRTALVGVDYQKITNGVAGPCQQYLEVGPIAWDVTYAAGALPLAGGGCDLDGLYDPAPPMQPKITVEVNGNTKTQVEVTFAWVCQAITLTVTGRWYTKVCNPPGGSGCTWWQYCFGTMTASYLRVADSGACNRDGLYQRQPGCTYVHGPTATAPPTGYILLQDVDPPTYPVACPDCLEYGGPGCVDAWENIWFINTPSCAGGGKCYRLHEEYCCDLMPPSITVFLQ